MIISWETPQVLTAACQKQGRLSFPLFERQLVPLTKKDLNQIICLSTTFNLICYIVPI